MTPEQIAELEALAEKATPGTLIAHGWGDGSTEMGMTNVFNEDAEALLMECIPEHDAALIVALVNNLPAILAALKAQQPGEDVVERVARAISRSEHGDVGEWRLYIPCARAAIAAMQESRDADD